MGTSGPTRLSDSSLELTIPFQIRARLSQTGSLTWWNQSRKIFPGRIRQLLLMCLSCRMARIRDWWSAPRSCTTWKNRLTCQWVSWLLITSIISVWCRFTMYRSNYPKKYDLAARCSFESPTSCWSSYSLKDTRIITNASRSQMCVISLLMGPVCK